MRIDRVWIAHAWAHGVILSMPIDAEAKSIDARLFIDSSSVLTASLRRTEFTARALPIHAPRVVGSIEGAIKIALTELGGMRLQVAGDVCADQLCTLLSASIDDGWIVARASTPSTDGEGLGAVVEGLSIASPIRLVADVSGRLPDALARETLALQGAIHAEIGDGSIDVLGELRSADRLDLSASALFSHLELRDLLREAPAGVIDGSADASLTVDSEGGLDARYRATSGATIVAGVEVPAITTRGTFDGRRLAGAIDVVDREARAHAGYALAPDPIDAHRRALDLDVVAEVSNLSRLATVGVVARGRGAIRARGRLTIDDAPSISATLEAHANDLSTGPVHLRSARVDASIDGALRAPILHVSGVAREVEVGAKRLADELVLSGQVSLGDGVAVRGFRARSTLADEVVSATVDSAQVDGSIVMIDGVSIEGLGGEIRANVMRDGGSVVVRASGVGIDLDRLAKLASFSSNPTHGLVSFETDLTVSPTSADGFFWGSLRDVELVDLGRANVDVGAAFEGHSAFVWVDGGIPDLVSIRAATSDVVLASVERDLASLLDATGGAHAEIEVRDLDRWSRWLPAGALPVERLDGALSIAATATRVRGEEPTWNVNLDTHGLRGSIAGSPPSITPRRFAGDVRSVVAWARGVTTIDLAVSDVHGPLVMARGTVTLPAIAVLQDPVRRREALLNTPFDITLDTPSRSLAELPDLVQIDRVAGDVSVSISASGTLRDPNVRTSFEAHGLRERDLSAKLEQSASGGGTRSRSFDARGDGSFASSRATAHVVVASRGRDLVDATVNGTVDLEGVIDGTSNEPRWIAGADVTLMAAPLRLLPMIAGQRVSGCVSGTVAIRGVHDAPTLDADLHVDGLRVGAVSYKTATLSAHAKESEAHALIEVTQDDGSLHLGAALGIDWGKALLPSLDRSKTADLSMDATAFRLSILAPFFRESLGNVDGLLDAKLRYRIDAGDARNGRLEGGLSIREGDVDVLAIGQELRNIEATIVVHEDGEIRLSNASARGITGRITMDGAAKLDGWELREASAAVRIARREAMILTYEGVEIGEGWGQIDVALRAGQSDAMTVDVSVPSFDLELPKLSTRSMQSLDDDTTVRTGTLVDGRFLELALRKPIVSPAAPGVDEPAQVANDAGVLVRVKLGRSVRVHHGSLVDLWASGGIQAAIKPGRVSVSGTVSVDRGFVEIQGRRFEIERATASFDPTRSIGEPTVRASARYQAPESTMVLADYSGSPQAGKLTLHSEPALPQSELLALIVFGSREGVVTAHRDTSEPNNAARAASLGGGVVTQGLNKALSDISPIDLSTRVDTSDGENPRPEVSLAITRKLSASVSYRVGVVTPGQNPDRSTLRLDYRFYPRWTLETSAGDAGTAIADVMWKLRY